jgi:hypothetical protein
MEQIRSSLMMNSRLVELNFWVLSNRNLEAKMKKIKRARRISSICPSYSKFSQKRRTL